MQAPFIDLNHFQSTCESIGRVMSVRVTLDDPQVVVLDNFLSEQECEILIDRYKTRTKPAGFYHKDSMLITDGRTSTACHLDCPVSDLEMELEARFEMLTCWPSIKTEPTSFVRYGHLDHIRPHHDYFGEDNIPTVGGQRVATAIVYLDDTFGAGATYFDTLGLRVHPRRGSLLFFRYPEDDARLRHSSPPLHSTEKHVLVKWFRTQVID